MKLRTAQKSTLSNKDDEWKCKQIIDYLFSPLRTHDEIRKIQSIIIGDIRRLQKAVDKDERRPKKHRHASPEYSYEDCNRLISAIFGEHQSLKSGNICNAKEVNEQVELSLSTTAKQTEEQLAQKVEVIHETPLVEAEKPKIEGFNTPPRVLGQNQKPNRKQYDSDAISVQHKFRSMVRRLEHNEILSDVTPMMQGVVYSNDFSNEGRKSGGTSGERKQDEYDSIAKRHLSTPNNELDNNLLKEMQKLGVPQVSGKYSTNLRVGSSKRPRKPSANDTELEARKCEHESTSFNEKNLSELVLQTSMNTKLHVSPPSDLASRLHEDRIRFEEQTTQSSVEVATGKNESLSEKISSSEAPKTNYRFANQRIQSSKVTAEKNEKHSEKIPPSDLKTSSVQNDKKILFDNATIRQEAEFSSRLSPLQALTLLPQLYPWSFKKLSSKNRQSACMYSTERTPPYDPQKQIDQEDKKKDITNEQKKDKNNPDSELVPNYEGLKLNRDKPYYDNISPSYSPSSFFNSHTCWPARHKYDKNSHRLYFNRNLPYYYNERLPFPGTYYYKINMWPKSKPNSSNNTEHENDETSDVNSHGLQFNKNVQYNQSPGKEEGLPKIIGQEDQSYLPAEKERGKNLTDAHPRILSERKTSEQYLNRDKPYCFNHHFPFSGFSNHQNILLTPGNESKDFQIKSHKIDPKLDLSLIKQSTDYPKVSSKDIKPDFVPETRDKSNTPVERLQGTLITATDRKEQLSCDQNIQSSPNFYYQYPWRSDYPYIKHQEATESAHAEAHSDNIMSDQITTEQHHERTKHNVEYQQHHFFHQLHPWIAPYQYTIPRETQESKDNANPDNIVLDQHTSEPFYEEHSKEQEFPNSYQLHPWNNPYQYTVAQDSNTADVYHDSNPDNVILDQDVDSELCDQTWTHPHQYSYQIQTVDESADDNTLFEQNTDDLSFDEEQQFHPWMLPNTNFQQHEHQTADYVIPANENPDNIFLEQNTGDTSYGESEQLHPWAQKNLSFQQQEFQTADYVVPADENPDNIFVAQNTDESNEDQELHPWTHPYQYSQRSYILPDDKYPDNNMFLQQDTDDSHEEFLHEPYPNYTFTRANRLEPLETILYTANSNPKEGQSCNFPLDCTCTCHHCSGPFNQYPQHQSQSVNNYPPLERQQDSHDSSPTVVSTDKRPPYDAHELMLDGSSSFDKSTSTYLDTEKSKVFPPNVGTLQRPFHVKSPRFFPQDSITPTPHLYHENYTCFRELPSQKKYWKDEMSRQQLQAPAKSHGMIVSDQKTPIQKTTVKLMLSSNQEDASHQASAASTASFVTLPRLKDKTFREPSPKELLSEVKLNDSILPEPSPEDISPDEAVDFTYQENVLSQVEVPLLEEDFLPLSEVLRRVRRRSRQEFLSRFIQVVEGKCGKCGDPPPCPIPPPKCPPPPSCKPPCPPPPPPCPRPCKPKCPPPCVCPPPPRCPPPCPPPSCPPPPPPKPCCKFQALDDASPKISSVLWDLGSPNVIFGRLPPNYFPQSAGSSKAIITETVTSQLNSIGNKLFSTYGSDLGSFCCKLENLANARGFEPWVPVPSWPIPVKEAKKPLVCPKEGCKQRPPPRYETPCAPPCTTGNPCLGFPNKYRKN